MALTPLDENNYIDSCLRIIREWMVGHFVGDYDADVRIIRKTLETPLVKPVIHIALTGGDSRGAGRGIESTGSAVDYGDWKELIFAIIVSTDEGTGGELQRNILSGKLAMVALANGFELGQAGLKKAKCSPPAVTDTENFYQYYHEFTLRILITHTAIVVG